MTTTPVSVSRATGPVDPEAAERLDTTARITAAARAELCQRPDDLSMRAVARRAGVDPRRVTALVESRDQLIANVLYEIAFDAHDALRPALAASRDLSARARLLALARAFRAWALANPAELWVLLGPRRRLPVDRSSAVRAMRWFYGPVLDVYRDGLASGEMRLDDAAAAERTAPQVDPVFLEIASDLDARKVAVLVGFVSGLHGYLLLEASGQLAALFGDPDTAFDAHVRALTDASGIA